MQMFEDAYGNKIQVFSPSVGVEIPTTYTPEKNEVICIASAVDITLDEQTVSYEANSIFGLHKDITYTFSSPTAAHKM